MMTAMNDFWDKVISMEFGSALLGAVAGGLFSMWGAWWQMRGSAKAAALAEARANAQRSFDTLGDLRVLLEAQTFQGIGSGDTRAAWNRELRAHIARAHSPIMLLPDQYEATRGQALILIRMIKNWEGLPPWPEYNLRTRLLLSEAIEFLGLFIRNSEVPEKRDMEQVIAKEIDLYKRQRAQLELESLEREAERTGLDEEDMERAREIREYLGIPHPPEASTDEDEETS